MLAIFENPGARLFAGALFVLFLLIYYRRFLRAENWRLVLLIGVIALVLEITFPRSINFLALFSGMFLLFSRINSKPVEQKYSPAMARIEGGGIKRGLTPPEAAIVLGRPLKLTLILVLFEMLRKGFILQRKHSPLQVELAPTFLTLGKELSTNEKKTLRRLAAQNIPASLHIYEEAFLEILELQSEEIATEIDYSIAIQPLIRFVASRVGGHDLEETKEYYRLLVDRAPKEARSDGVLTTDRQKVFDRNFAWLLFHDDFGSILDQDDYSCVPVWWRKEGANIPKPTFAKWAIDLIAAMERGLARNEIDLELAKEEDLLTATLMNEIARATFYG